MLESAGWFCYPSRGSRGIDIIAIAPPEFRSNGHASSPHLGLEIGGRSKSLRGAFAKMREQPQCPGMLLLVVIETLRERRRSLRWYANERGKHGGHADVHAAIAEARSL